MSDVEGLLHVGSEFTNNDAEDHANKDCGCKETIEYAELCKYSYERKDMRYRSVGKVYKENTSRWTGRCFKWLCFHEGSMFNGSMLNNLIKYCEFEFERIKVKFKVDFT